MNNWITSLVRTWVPIAIGALISWGVLPADLSESATLTFTGLITGAYYAVARLLEAKVPWVGYLLGSKKTPSY